jgi:hypothetical protein
MFNKQDIFRILYNMLKELTLIQEEKIRSTALIRNQNNNSTLSENSNDFTRMKLLLDKLKCKYQNSHKEWNDMQAKPDISLVQEENKETIKPMLKTAQQIVRILFNNQPFQNENTPFTGCSSDKIAKITTMSTDGLFEDSVLRGRIVRFCDTTHQMTNVTGTSTIAPRRVGDPA